MFGKLYKAQRAGFHEENEWLEGYIIEDNGKYYIYSKGSLVKPITSHYAYALVVEIDKETIKEKEENK